MPAPGHEKQDPKISGFIYVHYTNITIFITYSLTRQPLDKLETPKLPEFTNSPSTSAHPTGKCWPLPAVREVHS